jgi:hypothetical protein
LGVAAIVLGFIVWWPLGVALLAYVLWGGSVDKLAEDAVEWVKGQVKPRHSSGNAAFDAYREATLKRLEEEQAEFAAYVEKLRQARDQGEFDRFMAERKMQAPSA